MKRTTRFTSPLMIRLPADTHAALVAAADTSRKTTSDVVRTLIDQYLIKMGNTPDQMTARIKAEQIALEQAAEKKAAKERQRLENGLAAIAAEERKAEIKARADFDREVAPYKKGRKVVKLHAADLNYYVWVEYYMHDLPGAERSYWYTNGVDGLKSTLDEYIKNEANIKLPDDPLSVAKREATIAYFTECAIQYGHPILTKE